MMFALARQIPAADKSTQAGKWEKSRFMGVELTGKTLGIVGCGNIGSIVAERAHGLKMRVIAFDPFLSDERARDLNVQKVALDELLARADIITLHTPLTDSTRNLIDAKAIAKTKKGVRIINCARGGLVVEADLKTAIESGHVAGAALDVFLEEPAKQNPLFGMDQVITTPHLGAATSEAQENVAVQIAEQMADFLLTGAVSNALNMPSVTAEEAPKLRPYMKLAQQLGSFAGQLTHSGLKEVTIEYEGHVAELNTRPLTASALAALLAPMLDSVNMVNAPVLARERNIEVTEIKHDRPGDYQSMMRLAVTTDNRTRDVCGTLFGGDKPRIVEIKGIRIEAELGRHMLYTTNEDKPGFIGRLGSLLGEAGVNIATFHLGRSAPGADAIALIEVDQALSDALLAQVRQGSAEARRDLVAKAVKGKAGDRVRGKEGLPIPMRKKANGIRVVEVAKLAESLEKILKLENKDQSLYEMNSQEDLVEPPTEVPAMDHNAMFTSAEMAVQMTESPGKIFIEIPIRKKGGSS
jgi:D-3-phosphoglycerate dehydrogenase